MQRTSSLPGVRIAWIALAGTSGAMGMLGYRRGGAVELFAAGGHLLIASLPRAIAALVGVLIQGAWVLVWSVLLAAFLRRSRGAGASLAATITAGLALGVSMLLPDAVGGPVSTLTIAEMVLVHFVLALSFMIGTRLAPQGDGWGAR